MITKKAKLSDLIAATGLVILLKFDRNHRFFSPSDLEIWWMTTENDRAPLPYYIKLCASFQINWWIQTKVTVRKRSIRIKIGNFLSHVTLKFDGSKSMIFLAMWPWNLTSDFDLLHGSHICHWSELLKITWWYDDVNIVKKVVTDGRTEPFIELPGCS